MKDSRALLTATLTLAIIAFVSNALPSTVILDDDTRISPATSSPKGAGVPVDILLTASAALLVLIAFANTPSSIPKAVLYLPLVASIARAPPVHKISIN